MHFSIKRTTADNNAFRFLIKKLDHELWVELKEDQSTYDQYNTVSDITTAVVAYHLNDPVACGCFKSLTWILLKLNECLFAKNKEARAYPEKF